MLQIKNICKEYKTGGLVQKALDDVSLNLRENEFVAILGPSGSGKTTFLNIIGGLDRYDSGDLIINGISTRRYKDRDWDSYRNHTIGFVFQSYNLIPHQTVLSNVELALTISGVSKGERRRRAKKALEQVGLGNQLHKKPNQMSGGQMQRVAIARALVNDPDILLADEPTGALDSDTSIQVMELLKEVAKERLVVMVTHNPELAEKYATRIVNLRDGKIRADSMPYEIDEEGQKPPVHKNMGKASMSFLTALSLSFNNLRTKKGRTLLTSFAGSIGIIGIALILSLSTGVNAYIQSVEEDTLSEYPLSITSTGVDLASMMTGSGNSRAKAEPGKVGVSEMVTSMFSTMDANDLASLKEYLDGGESGIEDSVKSIEYTYSVSPQIYRLEEDGARQVNPDQSFSAMGLGSGESANSLMSMTMSTDVFFEMPKNPDLYREQYDVVAGRWPKSYQECVLVLTSNGNISDFMLYTLGLRNSSELDKMVRQFMEEENVETPEDIRAYSYEEILGTEFKLVNAADYYTYDSEYQVWVDKTEDANYMKDLVKSGETLSLVGIVRPSQDTDIAMLSTGIGYTPELTEHVIETAANRQIVKDQLAERTVNVFTGEEFGSEETENKFDLSTLFTVDEEAMADAFQIDESMLNLDLSGLSGLSLDTSALSQALTLDTEGLDLSKQLALEEMLPALAEEYLPRFQEIGERVDLTFSQEEISSILQDLVQGFQESMGDNPAFNVNGLATGFSDDLATEDARNRLASSLQSLVQSGVDVDVSYGDLLGIAGSLFTGYQEYAAKNQITDTTAASILGYLQTPEVQQSLTAQAERILKNSVTVNVTPEQIQETVIQNLMEGYQAYLQANAIPSASEIGDAFLAYLQSEDGQQRLLSGISESIDLEGAQREFTPLFQEIGETVQGEIEEQLGDAMESVMGQIGTRLESAMQQMAGQLGTNMAAALSQAMEQMGEKLENAISIDGDAFMDAIQINMDEEELSELLMSLMSDENAGYENNLRTLGYANLDQPSGIDLYPLNFESKAKVLEILDRYNQRMEENGQEEKMITYTDFVGTLMSSVTDIIDVISYVLVAFVAISLVVSSIMIGVITYISVLERKKEIGILRAIGASKRNISQVFNAETFIIGFCAGLLGIGITLLLLIPGNALIHSIAGRTDVNAILPATAAVVLVALSVLLTLLGGLIPSKKAAKSDPVAALRSE